MEESFITGTSDMSDFTEWWESHLPSSIIIYCLKGKAQMLLQFREYTITEGQIAIISPDMFPTFVSRTEDFSVTFCLMKRNFAEETLYGISKTLYDNIYSSPIVNGGENVAIWFDTLKYISDNYSDYQYRLNIIENVVKNIYLVYLNLWQQQYENADVKLDYNRPEQLCMKFYDLIFDHFKEHRDTRFYAEQLCISQNYLAMITRQVCNESPKDAINRMVVLELKYQIKNTTLTAEQIASALNFPDASYMHRYFKKHTGKSISQYRKDYNRNSTD